VPRGQNNEPVYITERALFARLRRALIREQGLHLHRCRWDSRWLPDTGRYYAADARSWIQERSDDLEGWAKEMGVLRPGEQLRDEAR
jgi:hypothetical protein